MHARHFTIGNVGRIYTNFVELFNFLLTSAHETIVTDAFLAVASARLS